MSKAIFLLGAALAVLPVVSPAKDYPLEFKSLTARKAEFFPGEPGTFAEVTANKPTGLVREPAAVSRRPLYGEFGDVTNRFVFRLDEKQNGKGYDQLIVDLNCNRDLTDDPVFAAAANTNASRSFLSEQRQFGPIPAPEDRSIGNNRPVLYGELNLYSMPSEQSEVPIRGHLRLMPGWYLETTAEFDGVKRRIGLADGDCDFRLGDIGTPITYADNGGTNWYFQGGDLFLEDADSSGKFEDSPLNPEHFPYFPMIQIGTKPYKIAVSADGTKLSVEPWSEPMAELSIQPHGRQVTRVQLALESAPGRWQLVQANVTEGKTQVPPGNYQLYACTIKDKTAAGGTLILGGTKRRMGAGILCPAGVTTPFKCGAPLEARVTSRRDGRGLQVVGESNTLLGRLIRTATQPQGPLEQRIEAKLVGAGGESYSDFTLITRGKHGVPPKPAFTITDADGKAAASGKMEYG